MRLPNNSYKSITNTTWVRARLCKLQKGYTRLAAASDEAYQLLACGSLRVLHDIAEILLKVALNKINQIKRKLNSQVVLRCQIVLNCQIVLDCPIVLNCQTVLS